MIRFKTIDPAEAEKTIPKPAAPAPAPVATTDEPVDGSAGAPPAKGLTRKTPLRAKKPDSTGLFRD